MKLTSTQLRKIIKEELGQMTQAPRKPAAGKSPNRNLRFVPGKKTKEFGDVTQSLPSLEYPKNGKPLQIGPLKVMFWASADEPETVWANWEGGELGSGNDSIEDIASILDDVLQSEAEASRADLEDTLSYVRELFGVE